MDPDNPIVRLCVAGMKAESDGRNADALALFSQAWEQSNDDFEASIAAHYVARHQKEAEETLRWNQIALARAEAVGDERVHGFFPSLYLNLGKSHEDLGHRDEAIKFYELASSKMGELPQGRYADVVRDGVQRALQRVS
jgi:tetratricopeptide (TPR) repeat protein